MPESGLPNSRNALAMTCSVVICTRNRPRMLEACLESLSAMNYPDYEVVVVDNGTDPTVPSIAAKWGARYINCPRGGLSHARNVGARAAHGDIVVYTDDDATAHPDWLKTLAAEFADPKVMVVTGTAVPTSLASESEQRLAKAMALGIDRRERMFVDKLLPDWFARTNFGGIGEGNNMAFRKKIFDWWDGFDERLGRGALLPGGEEHYAFFEIADAGYRIVFTPEAVVYHPLPATLDALWPERRSMIANATAYLTFLFFEQPRHIGKLLQFCWDYIVQKPRSWRTRTGLGFGAASRWDVMGAMLRGPFIYLKMLLRFRPAKKVETENSSENSAHPKLPTGQAS